MFLFFVFYDCNLCIHGDRKRKHYVSLVLECESSCLSMFGFSFS